MEPIGIGRAAPPFRLPSAQGGEIGLEDYRGSSNVIVWFTKGIGCPFCRQHMTHLARGYDRFRALGTEILEITSSPVARARAYASRFRLGFPYLCDPGYTVGPAYGLEVRSRSPVYYAKAMLAGMKAPVPENDFGTFSPAAGEMRSNLRDDDMGFFIVDRQGVIRYSLGGPYGTASAPRAIPSNDEIVRELERLRSGTAA